MAAKDNIMVWAPTTLVIGGRTVGSLTKDSVKLAAKYEKEVVDQANSTARIGTLILGVTATLTFGIQELVDEILTIIAGLDANGGFGSAAAAFATQYSCSMTITRGNGTTKTLSGTVEFTNDIELDMDARKLVRPPVTADFVADANGLAFLLSAAA